MVELQLDFDRSLDDWTINGSPGDCVEAIARGREMGLDKIGVTIYSLPREAAARIDYLQMIAEEVLARGRPRVSVVALPEGTRARRRDVAVAAPLAALWAVLWDVPRMVACVPAASRRAGASPGAATRRA